MIGTVASPRTAPAVPELKWMEQLTSHQQGAGIAMDVLRFDAAPLIAFIASEETSYGNETDG